MQRRTVLATLGTAGAVSTAGCGLGRSEQTLIEPTLHSTSSARRSLRFSADGEDIGSLGVEGTVATETIDLHTEIWHRDGTNVESINLRMWMPPPDTAATIAVVSPVEGDSSPPPSVSLYSPRGRLGTMIEINDLDDLANETISTLDFIIRPGTETTSTLEIDGTIELTNSDWLGTDYTLKGRLTLEFPALHG